MASRARFPFNIDDLLFTAGHAYLKKVTVITVEKLLARIRKIKYQPPTGEDAKSPTVENLRLPPFNLIFFRYVMNNNQIPTPEEFINESLSTYFEKVENDYAIKVEGYNGDKVLTGTAIEGRILRTYPSLVRDFYFYLVCSESKLFEELKYSIYNDYYKGVDLLLKYKGSCFQVSLHVATKRGDTFKEKKYSRHKYDSSTEVVLRLQMENMQRVGDLFLPKKETLQLLLNKLNELTVP